MNKEHCPNKAQFIVPWANKPYIYCKIHTASICAIGKAIGAPIQVQPITTDTNCEGIDDIEPEKDKNRK